MSKKDIQLLLIVFGILIAFSSWQFAYKPNQEKTKKVKTENTSLQSTVHDLEVLDAKKEQYLADIEKMKEECVAITNSFASDVLEEDKIMYLYNMELVDANEVKVPSIDMRDATEVAYNAAATTNANATTDGTTSQDTFQPTDEGIRMYSEEATVSFTTTNSGLKNIVRYVYDIPIRKALNTVNLTFNENGYLTGSMDINFYSLTGTDVPYSTISIPGVPTGTDNIFGVRDGGNNNIEQQAAGEE